MLQEEGSAPTAQGRMGLKLLWPPANLQETSFPPFAKLGCPTGTGGFWGAQKDSPWGHGDGDVLGLLVQGECPLHGAGGAWFDPQAKLYGAKSSRGSLGWKTPWPFLPHPTFGVLASGVSPAADGNPGWG